LDRSSLSIDVVRRGVMRREVRAAGTLVPEHVRIVAATTAGRVERLLVHPGDTVAATTELVELSNSDVELQALQAEQAVTEADEALASVRASLEQQRLAEDGAIASLTTQHRTAQRSVVLQEELARQALGARADLEASRDASQELTTRLGLERQRAVALRQAGAEQVRLAKERAERLRAIAREQRDRVASMRVLAGEQGVVQTLGSPPLEVGQWVQSGYELARVAAPRGLKALLRVPEVAAKDIAVGQRAEIDTRGSVIPGHVVRANPSSQSGTVAVDVALDAAPGPGIRADLNVDGTIELERLPNAVHITRPANAQSEATMSVFKIEPNHGYASRVRVRLGRGSENTIEILQGLAPGDSVVISDVAIPEDVVRVRLR
jgi:multidrug efflux pump subunit AcrA (membrane-fusion protein)